MAKLHLKLAMDRYDFLLPFQQGKLEAQGLDIELVTLDSKTRHERMWHDQAFDACEFSMGGYIVARARGSDSLSAIPYFPRRMFGHHYCFVRADSDVRKPADLRGGRIGIRTYENTLAIFVKGMFAHDYGLPVEDVTWVCANNELVGTKPPASIKVEQLEPGSKLEDLLIAGEIDASVEPALPRSWVDGGSKLRRLFPDFREAEQEYYRRTNVFPIMHPIVLKAEIAKYEPWVARSLFDLLVQTQRRHRVFMQQPQRLSFAFGAAYVEEERAFFGKDPFAQGLRENRHDLETLIAFCDEQGVLDRRVTADELFSKNTQST